MNPLWVKSTGFNRICRTGQDLEGLSRSVPFRPINCFSYTQKTPIPPKSAADLESQLKPTLARSLYAKGRQPEQQTTAPLLKNPIIFICYLVENYNRLIDSCGTRIDLTFRDDESKGSTRIITRHATPLFPTKRSFCSKASSSTKCCGCFDFVDFECSSHLLP